MLTQPTTRFSPRVLFTPSDLSPGRILLIRIGLVLCLFTFVFALLWFDREGLRDHADGHVSFTDVVYFTMITITTVGYGDIVPVSARARLLDALVVTPIRIVVWFLFLGTAYQLIIRQYMEEYRMARLQAKLEDHIIVCGFGHTGFSTVKELLAKGTPAGRIVVIDPRDDRVRLAIAHGVAAFQGDATHEDALRDALVEKAKAIIISAGRDDSSALILLTARHLNHSARIIVSAKEEENVKLFKQGGANAIVSPATFGGYLVAAAVDHTHLVQYFEDLLTAGGRVNLVERPVQKEEVGKTAADLKPSILLRVYRPTTDTILSLAELDSNYTLRAGDVLVLLSPPASTTEQET